MAGRSLNPTETDRIRPTDSEMLRRTLPAFALTLLALPCARSARAELVILDDGRVLKVRAYEADLESASLTMVSGVRMRLPIERVDRVVEDEIELPPDPPPVLLAQAPPPAAPPLLPLSFEDSQEVPAGPYGALIYEKAKLHKVNPRLVAAVIGAESAGNPHAVSHKGARGLMQVMPATAERFGVEKRGLLEPKNNVEAGVKYLAWLIEQFPGDLTRVVAAYNAGEQAVWRYGGIPPYRETQGYVRRIYSILGLASLLPLK